jgi:hypothetical protein
MRAVPPASEPAREARLASEPAPEARRAWNPANSVEWALRRCLTGNDAAGFLQLLCTADLFLPGLRPDGPTYPAAPDIRAARTPPGPTADPGGQRLLTTRHQNRTYLAVYTSPETMYQATGDLVVGWHLTSMSELTAKWPDERWGLAINPGLSMGGYLDREQVAELGRILAALPPFQPSGPVEQLLHTAARNADLDAYLLLVWQTPLLVGRGTPRGPAYRIDSDEQGPLVAAYTSGQRLAEDDGDPEESMYTDLTALARDWPDPGCRLVVNRGSVLEVIIDGGRVPALPGELAAVVAAATAGGSDDAGVATGAGGPAVLPAPNDDRGPAVPGDVLSAPAAQGQIEVAVDAATARKYLASGYASVTGHVLMAGQAAGPGHRVRWREPNPGGGIQPGIDVRDLPLPPGALLIRASGGAEEVLATYHPGPNRWVAPQPAAARTAGTPPTAPNAPGEPAGSVTG